MQCEIQSGGHHASRACLDLASQSVQIRYAVPEKCRVTHLGPERSNITKAQVIRNDLIFSNIYTHALTIKKLGLVMLVVCRKERSMQKDNNRDTN
jgi:hypothetical protein